jgi:hypothetical protein
MTPHRPFRLLSGLLVLLSSAPAALDAAEVQIVTDHMERVATERIDGDVREAPQLPCHCHQVCRHTGHCRAGWPQRIRHHAIPSVTSHYSVGYVGGGAPIGGGPRCPDEGTFGLDYSGILSSTRVWLNWWHGRHRQGGGGAYRTDGPHFLAHE